MRSSSDTQPYRQICHLAATTDMFYSFKSHPQYTKILEHVTQQHGQQYYDIIVRDNPSLLSHWDKFLRNDIIGSPHVYPYGDIKCSPTTLRYMKVLSDLLKYKIIDNGYSVVEIGGGYGGQCLIIQSVIDVREYLIYDINEPLELIGRYLDNFNVPAYIEDTDCIDDDVYNLVISNYAFSEIDTMGQDEYITKVLNNATHGYLTCNFISDSYNIDQLRERIDHDFIVIGEDPLTHPLNKIIIW